MAIRPPSDIVLDVARAIDPLRYQQAVSPASRACRGRLGPAVRSSLQPDRQRARFPARQGRHLDPRRRWQPHQVQPAHSGRRAGEARHVPQVRSGEPLDLRPGMLPQKADAVFGEGTAGDVWKSMLAEQIANQMAAGGGIGIAAQLAKSNGADHKATPSPSAIPPSGRSRRTWRCRSSKASRPARPSRRRSVTMDFTAIEHRPLDPLPAPSSARSTGSKRSSTASSRRSKRTARSTSNPSIIARAAACSS